MSKKIKVYTRVRPFLPNECPTSCLSITNQNLVVSGSHSFKYDKVFGMKSTSQDIFLEIGQKVSDTFLDGYNTSSIVYGQTGSGKTYTTLQLAHDVVQEIFHVLCETSPDKPLSSLSNVTLTNVSSERSSSQGRRSSEAFTLHISAIEVYNDQLRDLLDTKLCDSLHLPSLSSTSMRRKNTYTSNWNSCVGALTSGVSAKPPLALREDVKEGLYIVGLTSVEVREKDETLACMAAAFANRKTASTSANTSSSRSHCIFTLALQRKGVISKCCFVDLAGSERFKKTHYIKNMTASTLGLNSSTTEHATNLGAIAERMREGISINSGLLALGNVIVALAGKKSHVPYRSSKLTRLLEPMLGGNSRTFFVACVSPLSVMADETLNTLKYAERAKLIRTKPKLMICNLQSLEQAEKMIISLQKELRELRMQLRSLRRGNNRSNASLGESKTEDSLSEEALSSRSPSKGGVVNFSLSPFAPVSSIQTDSDSKKISDLQKQLDEERRVNKLLKDDLFYNEYANMMQAKACDQLKQRVLELEKLMNSDSTDPRKIFGKSLRFEDNSPTIQAGRCALIAKNLTQLRRLEDEWCSKRPQRV